MENPDIDRPAVHIGFPFFAALFVASFFGAPFAAVSAVLLFAAVFLLFLFKQHRQRPNFVLPSSLPQPHSRCLQLQCIYSCCPRSAMTAAHIPLPET